MAERPAAARGNEGRQLADGSIADAGQAEKLRLETLREYRIMDTGPEEGFDRVTKMVADLFDAPIALVSLVDDCRQWFKSSYGLDSSETPRDISFCQYVIAEDQPVMIVDALEDERFRDNSLVTGEPFIRFYAGVPLRAYNGMVLGTLCLIDRDLCLPGRSRTGTTGKFRGDHHGRGGLAPDCRRTRRGAADIGTGARFFEHCDVALRRADRRDRVERRGG